MVSGFNLIFLSFSASQHRFLLGAELIGLKKRYKDGTMRGFTEVDGANFQGFYGKLMYVFAIIRATKSQHFSTVFQDYI